MPAEPQDSGNVTFLISNTTPPRADLLFPKIPTGLVNRGLDTSDASSTISNRITLGDLIFSVSSSKRQSTSNNARQFEIGEVLEFDNVDSKAVDPMLVNTVTEIQHNTNVLDYATLGMSEDDQAIIAQQSLITHERLTNELNALKRQRADAEIEINVQQKVINETDRTIDALEVIAKTSSAVTGLIAKLKQTRDTATVARDTAITNANTCAAQSEDVLAELRAVAMVLK